MKHYVKVKNVCNNGEEIIVGPCSKTEVVDVVSLCQPSEDWDVTDALVLTLDEFRAEVDTTPKLVVKGRFLKFVVEVNYTANDWQLYTSKEGVVGVTKALNCDIEEALAIGAETWLEIYRNCHNALARYREFGACDTEPRGVLIDLLRELGMPEGVV